MQITSVGLNIAKTVLQVPGIEATEKVVVRKQLRRGQVLAFFEVLAPCLMIRRGGTNRFKSNLSEFHSPTDFSPHPAPTRRQSSIRPPPTLLGVLANGKKRPKGGRFRRSDCR